MAFDQVSLLLYPPRWRRYSEQTQAMHYSGEPVRTVSAVRASGEGQIVSFDDVCDWFLSNRFDNAMRSVDYALFQSASIDSVLGYRQPEIEVHASAEQNELSSLYCRFLLTRDTPVRLEHWEMFMLALCREFCLGISVSDYECVGPEEFLIVIHNADNWRYFAEQFGWEIP